VLQFSAEKRVIEPASFCDHIREKLTSPSSPDDRHAITNIVGPIVLLGGRDIANEFPGGSYYVEGGGTKAYPPKRDAATLNPGTATRERVSGDHRPALTVVFRAVELLPESSTQGEDAMQSQKKREETKAKLKKQIITVLSSLPAGKEIRVTLVDDQWHHGWYEWLKSIFPDKTVFTISPDPEFLLQKLYAAKDRDADLRFEFDLSPPGENADGQYADVLLLDLRLFSGNSAGEADFYKKLLPLCRKQEVSESEPLVPLESQVGIGAFPRIKNLAWRGFSTTELESAEAWVAGGSGQTEANHLICLTLLPRLLALADMSLPIMIFSSTGQADISKAFAGYGNVINPFEKPRFFGVTRKMVIAQVSRRLEVAWDHVSELLIARSFAKRLKNHRFESKPIGFCRRQQTGSESWHVELYLDETGHIAGRLTVGGILTVYPPGQTPDGFNAALNKAYRAIRTNKSFSRDNCQEIAAFLVEESAKRHIHIGIVRLSGSTADSVYSDLETSDELHDERVADNLHRELLRSVVEAAIYFYGRKCIPRGAHASFSVRAATRAVPLPKSASLADTFCARLEEEWGVPIERVGLMARFFDAADTLRNIPRDPFGEDLKSAAEAFLVEFDKLIEDGRIEEPTSLIKYFDFDSARPLVEEVMREYRDTIFSPVARIARAFPLNSHGRPESMRIPPLHFYADAVLVNRNNGSAMESLRAGGFDGCYGHELQVLLNAHRHLCCSTYAEALACLNHPALRFVAISPQESKAGLRSLNALLLDELAECLLTLSGREFCNFVRMLSMPPTAQQRKPSVRKGRVKRCYARQPDGKMKQRVDFCFICDDSGPEFFLHRQSCPGFDQLQDGQEVRFVGVRDRILGRYNAIEVNGESSG
jgi:cold shock CspA family protein